MPGFEEVRIYLTGLWLLLRGESQGFRYLDLSPRGVSRSFWSALWSLPAMLVSWMWWRRALVGEVPAELLGGVFFLRMIMLEVANWVVPLLIVAALSIPLGIARHFNAIVVTSNWLSLPIAYGYAVLIALTALLPALGSVIVLLWMLLLIGVVVAIFRLLLAIIGPQTLLVSTLTMLLLVPATLLSDFLERYLDVAPL
ncbi:hypothetical protein [Rhizobium paknamense]|uniref:Yip1 domain-containing protein n=1 Tax=Rhizobium paknamense TaxID=1206817 RepID=A0ABU0IAK6_9HYPH|nr:hypothetical protein [Rhizobium paknamense]MDQ0455267.1 hypothetical protein [Rhizobium paknamense]